MALPASFADEAWRHIAGLIHEFGGRPQHKCARCINAFACTCHTAHTWYYCLLDPNFQDLYWVDERGWRIRRTPGELIE